MRDDIGLPYHLGPCGYQIFDRDGNLVASTLVGSASPAIAKVWAQRMVRMLNGAERLADSLSIFGNAQDVLRKINEVSEQPDTLVLHIDQVVPIADALAAYRGEG